MEPNHADKGIELTANAARVLANRYLLKNEQGEIVETPNEMFTRVAKVVAAAEANYPGNNTSEDIAASFYREMVELKFLPNSPTLMNAGTEIGQLSACFVLPVEDSIGGIFDALKNMAIIHQSGGGTGFSFSRLRPKGDRVWTTMGVASGPVSFMRVFDASTEVVRQGGRRRGANMGILRVDHPDILEFITCKDDQDSLKNFNISVAVTDEFMTEVIRGGEYDLSNPRTGSLTRSLNARFVFDLLATSAWRTGDPGIVFIDRINEANPTPAVGAIESTNPCGEQPLLPNESCNLGSLNIGKFVSAGRMDWDALAVSIKIAVRFLDDVIDVTKFPLEEVAEVTRANRKVGLGVMGFADALIKQGIPYGSDAALSAGESVMRFIAEQAAAASAKLALERGSFANFEGSLWQKRGYSAMRNATLTTVAPTGTISIIAGASSGIEPLFAISYVRRVMEGTGLLEVNTLFEEEARAVGIYSESLLRQIGRTGSLAGLEQVPDDMRRLFITAFDIEPRWHVLMQAAFQKYVDNGVSKTVNLPDEAGLDTVKQIFLTAYELHCKGITVYRYGSKKEQVLNIEKGPDMEQVDVDSEYAGGCLSGECPF